jgi:hypothetical protein
MQSRIVRTAVVSATIALAFVASSYAQDPAPAPAPLAAPPMDCQKPGDFAPLDRSSPEAGRFQKKLEEYKVCVGAYARTNGAKANELAAQSRVYSDAANKAIDDYNAYVTQINDKTKADLKK